MDDMSLGEEFKIFAMAAAVGVSSYFLGAPVWAALLAFTGFWEFLLHDERTRAERKATAARIENIVRTKALEIKEDAKEFKNKIEKLGEQVQNLKEQIEAIEETTANQVAKLSGVEKLEERIEAMIDAIETRDDRERRIAFRRRLANEGLLTPVELDESMELEKSGR
jgi:septal ring factor EnvC (AmiA/AmiB activator)